MLKFGGAGNKFLNIIEGKAELYFREGNISKWDLCAGEALLMSYGGKMITFNGE